MTLPPETRVLPGHTDETTIGREWEENPFVTLLARRGAVDRRAVRVGGEDATLVVWSPDYDGKGKAMVRFATAARRSSAAPGSSDELHRRREAGGVRRAAHDAAEPLLAELAAETRATMASPQMLTGPIEGRFLELLVPGTGAGACSRSAPSPATRRSRWPRRSRRTAGSTPATSSREHAEVAQRYFDRSPHGDKITLHLGPALETIETLEGEFDFVFIDADKENYDAYYEAVLPVSPSEG